MTPDSIPSPAGRRMSVSALPFPRRLPCIASALGAALLLGGCEYDSWFDPSRTGYFEHTPTSIPVLRKIDVIEVEDDAFATEVGPPTAKDLIIGSPEYIYASGDIIEVQINDLFQIDKAETFRRTIDQSGKIVLPVIGSVIAGGLSQTQLVTEISNKLKTVIRDPRVDITIVQANSFNFTVDGQVRNSGVYALSRPDFDIVQAIALAGGANEGTKRIRVVRLIDEIPADAQPGFDPNAPAAPNGAPGATSGTAPNGAGSASGIPTKPPLGAGSQPPMSGGTGAKPAGTQDPPPLNIDDLINQIKPTEGAPTPPASGAAPPPAVPPAGASGAAPAPIPAPIPIPEPPGAPEPAPAPAPASDPAPAPSPGAMRTPPTQVDVDQLAPPPLESPKVTEKPVVDAVSGTQAPPTTVRAAEAQYIFDVQKQEWVLVQPGAAGPAQPMTHLAAPNSPEGAITGAAAAGANPHTILQPADFRLPSGRKTRVIVVDWAALQKGDLTQNVIVRPGDKIHVESDLGVVYIDGEVSRVGVYSMPLVGELTLSRLVTAAGGLGQIAIPQRVDLVRRIAPDREAAVRVNLAAIRNRAEPDIVMRADDHVIIGTNFIATPLAVIRNGFRMTYGFGFLIDRNFGNDVFGPPPYSPNQ